MDTFNFPYHATTHLYPKGDAVQFGKGYMFTAAPQLPYQRTFRLHFNTMAWFLNDAGQSDPTTQPQLNIHALINFYEAHTTNTAFIYPHPVFGNITVKFSPSNPFEVPKSLDGGNGATDSFELFLVEQPGM